MGVDDLVEKELSGVTDTSELGHELEQDGFKMYTVKVGNKKVTMGCYYDSCTGEYKCVKRI